MAKIKQDAKGRFISPEKEKEVKPVKKKKIATAAKKPKKK